MRLKENASVVMPDGKVVGHVDRVVIDPQTKEVSHVVVRKGFLFTEDKVLPMDLIARTTEDEVLLRPDAGDLETRTEKNIPEGTVALAEGAKVISAGGEQVGTVEQVLTDSQADRATHFVISQGLLMKSRKLIPTAWISDLQRDEVRLGVGSELLKQLRDYEPEKR